MRALFTVGATALILSACAGPDYNAMSSYEIMGLGYDDLCRYAEDHHPKIMAEVSRRKLTCDSALDYCTHDMGLTHGTGDFANCVVGIKNVQVQQTIAHEQAEANNIARQHQDELERAKQRQEYIDAGKKVPWWLR